MKHRTLAAVALLSSLGLTPLAAQGGVGGSVTIQVKTHLPDSLAAMTGNGEMEVLMTMRTDGERIAMEMDPSGGAAAGIHIKMVFKIGGDSVHMGLLMSPDMVASTGMPGMRLDMPMSMIGTANPLMGGTIDSIRKVTVSSTYRSLGTSATVAGIRCAEWQVVAGADTSTVCVVPTPPELLALQARLAQMAGVKDMLAQFAGITEAQKNAFGGKAMTPIRTVSGKSSVELVSFSAVAPASSEFELPANLQPMPMPSKPGGGAPLR